MWHEQLYGLMLGYNQMQNQNLKLSTTVNTVYLALFVHDIKIDSKFLCEFAAYQLYYILIFSTRYKLK